MMRATVRRSAPLISTAAPADGRTVTNHLYVTRLLGGYRGELGSAHSYSAIMEKTELAEAARLGRATALFHRGHNGSAAADAANVIENTTGTDAVSTAVRRAAYSLRIRALTADAAHESVKESISGASQPGAKDQASRELTKAINDAKSACSGWALSIVDAETTVARGNDPNGAVATFTNAANELQTARTTVMSGMNETLDCNVAKVAFKAAVAHAHAGSHNCFSFDSVKVKDASAALLLPTAAEIKAAREVLPMCSKLSDDEFCQLAAVIAAAVEGNGHVLDLSPQDEAYRSWEGARNTIRMIDQFRGIASSSDYGARLCKGIGAVGTNNKNAAVADKLKQHKAADGHILDFIGNMPKSQISADDLDYVAAVNAIGDEFNASAASTGNATNNGAQKSLIVALLDQAAIRAQVGIAAAKHASGDLDGALATINTVIDGNAYVDMWRALLLRGAVCKDLGQIEESDASFKLLHALKHPRGGVDIPLLDQNRYKSAF